jgi:hypothetical protein
MSRTGSVVSLRSLRYSLGIVMHFLPDRSFLAVIDAQDVVNYIVAILCDHLEDEMADPRRALAIGQATKGLEMDVDERDALGRGLVSFSEVSCRQSWEAAARTLRTGSCGVESAGIEAASASPMAKCSLMIVPPHADCFGMTSTSIME